MLVTEATDQVRKVDTLGVTSAAWIWELAIGRYLWHRLMSKTQ